MQTYCIVIPCYNEANRLPVDAILSFLESSINVDICFVNDGSSDETISLLHQLKEKNPQKISVLDQKQNQGKAEAVRAGVLSAFDKGQYDYIGYFDADLATPLVALFDFIEFSQNSLKHSFVIGSRIKRMGAIIERKATRHYLGRIFSTFASLVLRLPIYDTQCGAKMIKRDIIGDLFARPFMSRWLFDLEIFARAIHKLGYQSMTMEILEVPLKVWIEKGDSRLKLKDIFRAPVELWRIHREYRIDKVVRKKKVLQEIK